MLEVHKRKMNKTFLYMRKILVRRIRNATKTKKGLMSCIHLNFLKYKRGLDSRFGVIQKLRHSLQFIQTLRV